MSSIKLIKVCAALIVSGERLLLAKRKPGLQQGGLWEFPGGKQEPGESPRQCLVRELREELGIDAAIGDFFARTTYAYPDYTIVLSAYWAACPDGAGQGSVEAVPFDNFILTDHAEVRWVNDQELQSLRAGLSDGELAPADIPIADKLLSQHCLQVEKTHE